ncbi:hypothetical protein AB0H43_29990 [Hamadaea sp. NPDC050747]|uniref:hypothetical protein n=1 Tax=Hamadaea sp. NPDC050747 TaxID=3155789 RepID=UPI0033FFCCA3
MSSARRAAELAELVASSGAGPITVGSTTRGRRLTAGSGSSAGSGGGSRAAAGVAAAAESVTTAGELAGDDVTRMLPVTAALQPLLPGGGLRRGSTVTITRALQTPGGDGPPGGALRAAATRAAAARSARTPRLTPLRSADRTSWGGTSVMLALLAEASQAGSWCAIVGLPDLGVAAAAELGIVLERLALVPHPGAKWQEVVATLLDGFDLVVVAVREPVTPQIAARLSARARLRGSVLLPMGPWDSADLVLEPVGAQWQGLGPGHGRLRCRHLTIAARGRGTAARPREVDVWLPTETGGIRAHVTEATVDPRSSRGHLRAISGG